MSWATPSALTANSLLRERVHLGHFFRRQLPAGRGRVRFDLGGGGRARDHARDHRLAGQPAEGELEQRVAAGERPRLERADALEVAVVEEASPHGAREPRARGGGLALAVLARE